MSGPVHTRKAPKIHTTPRIILIRAGIDHKGGKALPQNTGSFLRLELKTSG